MSELTPLEVLTNIKDAAVSESIGQLFGVVREAVIVHNELDFIDRLSDSAVTTDELRADVVVESTETEREIMIKNFPLSKNNYLVVPKVIEE